MNDDGVHRGFLMHINIMSSYSPSLSCFTFSPEKQFPSSDHVEDLKTARRCIQNVVLIRVSTAPNSHFM